MMHCSWEIHEYILCAPKARILHLNFLKFLYLGFCVLVLWGKKCQQQQWQHEWYVNYKENMKLHFPSNSGNRNSLWTQKENGTLSAKCRTFLDHMGPCEKMPSSANKRRAYWWHFPYTLRETGNYYESTLKILPHLIYMEKKINL